MRGQAWQAQQKRIEELADFACTFGVLAQSQCDELKPLSDRSVYCDDTSARVISASDTCWYRIFGIMVSELCREIPPCDQNRGAHRGDLSPQTSAHHRFGPPNGAFQLRDLAVKTCSRPGSLTESDLDQLAWFPDPRIYQADAVAAGLSGCSRSIFQNLVHYSRTLKKGVRLDVRWLNAEAARLTREAAAPPPADPRPEPSTGDDSQEDRPSRRDPCYYEPGVGRVCPVR